ncbi:MAG: dihydroorotase family protein, partial [Nitrosopumilus sp.]|nr:dihydroorotase family protein [Nitrosopumilus sp.]
MTYDTIITNSHIILPQGMIDKNILIDDGKIVGFTNDVPVCDHKINGNGLISIPGPIDTHVHYGVYSPINEAAKTESHAAAIGGITTMMRMLRLGDPFSKSLQEQLDSASQNHYVDYTIHASVFNPQQINEMNFCVEKGITSFKIYMNLGGEVGHVYMDMPPNSSQLVLAQVDVTDDIVENTVKTAASLGCPVLVHAEDYESCGCGIKTAKERKQDGLWAWSESRSPEFEAKAIKTVSKFGRNYNCVIYFVHIGSERALRQIEEEKKLGTKIFVETCPHYLTLSYEKQEGYLAKVMPPIRTENDRKAIWNALSHNLIDTVGTDHVANQLKLKLGGDDVWGALAGFPGIGTALPILLNDGVNQNRINLEQLVKLTSQNAAQIFSMYPQKGTLEKNSDADITMIDL